MPPGPVTGNHGHLEEERVLCPLVGVATAAKDVGDESEGDEMRRIPPSEWIELHDLVSFEDTIVIEHAHPTLYDGAHCEYLAVDYDPFEDVLEIMVSTAGKPFRLLIDDPQEISLEPGLAFEIASRHDRVLIRALTDADLDPGDLRGRPKPSRSRSIEARRS